MSNLFQTIEQEAFRAGITPRTRESRAWFQRKLGSMRTNRRQLMNEPEIQQRQRSAVGGMYMFFYDPKHRQKLPYYDSFPLVIAVQKAAGGFHGLNLHYLPMTLRAKLLDGLMDITSSSRYDESARFAISYEYLKKSSKTRYYKPCYKHYLTQHIEGKLAMVPSPEWEIATFLPTAQWNKASQTKVWSDSRSKL
jgi:hypothetical protein